MSDKHRPLTDDQVLDYLKYLDENDKLESDFDSDESSDEISQPRNEQPSIELDVSPPEDIVTAEI